MISMSRIIQDIFSHLPICSFRLLPLKSETVSSEHKKIFLLANEMIFLNLILIWLYHPFPILFPEMVAESEGGRITTPGQSHHSSCSRSM